MEAASEGQREEGERENSASDKATRERTASSDDRDRAWQRCSDPMSVMTNVDQVVVDVVDHSDQKFLLMRCDQLVTHEQALRPRPTRAHFRFSVNRYA
jgi:hypothetical protein